MRLAHAGVAVVVAALAVARPAAADGPSADSKAVAERLYNDGIALMQKKDYAPACAKFAESLRIETGIGVMLRLADCFDKQGKRASAWGLFREAAELADKERDDRAAVARRKAAAIEPMLSTLTIVVPKATAVDGLEIKRDGALVGEGQWGTAVPLDPGSHTITAAAPHHLAWSTTTQLGDNHAAATVTVPALAPEPVTATTATTPALAGTTTAPPTDSTSPTTPPSSGLGTRQITGIVVAGLGVVGVGLGAYFGLHAKSLFDQSNEGGHCVGDNCDQTGTNTRNSARDSAMGSNIAFGVGLAAIAGGAVIYFTAPKGQTVTVGVAPLGRDGAALFGRASW